MKAEQKRHAVVIDDNPIHRLLLQEMLHLLGFDLVMTPDWIGGLALVIHDRPNLVLADMDTARGAAKQAVSDIERRFVAGAPVLIGMTSGMEEEKLEAYAAMGFAAFLWKPFCTADLQECIERAESAQGADNVVPLFSR